MGNRGGRGLRTVQDVLDGEQQLHERRHGNKVALVPVRAIPALLCRLRLGMGWEREGKSSSWGAHQRKAVQGSSQGRVHADSVRQRELGVADVEWGGGGDGLGKDARKIGELAWGLLDAVVDIL